MGEDHDCFLSIWACCVLHDTAHSFVHDPHGDLSTRWQSATSYHVTLTQGSHITTTTTTMVSSDLYDTEFLARLTVKRLAELNKTRAKVE